MVPVEGSSTIYVHAKIFGILHYIGLCTNVFSSTSRDLNRLFAIAFVCDDSLFGSSLCTDLGHATKFAIVSVRDTYSAVIPK